MDELWKDRYKDPERLDFSRIPEDKQDKVKREIAAIQDRDKRSLCFFKLITTPQGDIYLQTILQKKLISGGNRK